MALPALAKNTNAAQANYGGIGNTGKAANSSSATMEGYTGTGTRKTGSSFKDRCGRRVQRSTGWRLC